MCQGLDESKMACRGASTRTVHTGTGDMEECRACGSQIAHDLVSHPFLGFQAGCEHASSSIQGESR